MSMLVVSGVMIGYICSAVTELVVTFAQDADIVNLHNWSLGSFSGTTWSSVRAACICVTVIFVLVFLMSKPLSAYQLGESYALNLGVNVRLLRIGMVVFSSILSACVVAFAGPISFVGIAVPQLVKKMLGTAEPIWMIPASFLGGSVFCLFCDLLARTLFAPTELSISTVTAVFGAPVVSLGDGLREKGESGLMTYYFQAKQLCVGYQNQPLIQNIEIELKKGEIMTLIGPNGAGKSTILKSIARQLELLGGSVLLEDKNLQSLSGNVSWQKRWRLSLQNGHIQS